MRTITDHSQPPSNPIIAKLERALLPGGDFPIAASVLTEVLRLTEAPDTPIDRLVDVIRNEPTLTARVIHAANHLDDHDRGNRYTLSQAIIHLGMRSLTDLCGRHILVHRYGDGLTLASHFVDALRRSIMIAALSEQLAQQTGSTDGRDDAYIAGMLYSVGPVVLAYYFPKALEAALERARLRKRQLSQGIFEVVGISPIGLSMIVLQHLAIPEYYRAALRQIAQAGLERAGSTRPRIDKQSHWLVPVVTTAAQVVEGICNPNSTGTIQSRVQELGRRAGFAPERIEQLLVAITEHANRRCAALGIVDTPRSDANLPARRASGKTNRPPIETPISPRAVSVYVQQLEKAVDEQHSLTAVLTAAMEALVFGERCERALLLFPNRRATKLQGKMSLGKPFPKRAEDIERPIDASRPDLSPDIRAFQEGRMVTSQASIYGAPGWGIGIPIGAGNHRVGVLYAESRPNTDMNARVESLRAIASLLDRAARDHQQQSGG